MAPGSRLAVIGGGWSGLAAAVEAVRAGHAVTLYEMAAQFGGRARDVHVDGEVLDNGQHILIGAYTETLRLMRTVGVDEHLAFVRTPLRIGDAEGHGLYLQPGRAAWAFASAVLQRRGWGWRDRLALLAAACGWALRGFRCDPMLAVAELTRGITPAVRGDLIDPLCVAALNTPSAQASAAVFLRVLQDALFSGPGSADLLLPKLGLGALLPAPAERWLVEAGAVLRRSNRVASLQAMGSAWSIDGEIFDRVVLATPPAESARLVQPIAAGWAQAASRLHYEPIVTVYLDSPGTRLPEPMLALREGPQAPAQFVFDRGQLGGPEGRLAFVISGAQPWVERGAQATLQATREQAQTALHRHLRSPLQRVKLITEKRATFRCVPGLQRPALQIAPGLHAAGDHVAGPYPATLEAAVRSAVLAVRAFE